MELTEDLNPDEVIEKFKQKYAGKPMNTVDGLKIEFDDEWVHLRKSNTEPIIRIYAESSSETAANHLAEKIKSDVKSFV